MESDQEVHKDIHEIKNAMTKLSVRVELVYGALVGNELLKDGGLVNVIFHLRAEVKALDIRIDGVDERIDGIDKKEAQRRLYVKIIWAALAVIATIIIERIFSKI